VKETLIMVELLTGAGALISRYEVLFCDVWGVLHDGRTAYPGANSCLPRFRAGGGRVILVSNAPLPGDAVAGVLDSKGVSRLAWDAIVSSGDLTRLRMANQFRVIETIPVKTRSGKPISGLLNPQTKATKDTGLDMSGNVLPDNADNLDLEGLVRLSDGSFWIGEEMGPSIAQLSSDGRILRRFVPEDQVGDYQRSEAEIIGALPAVLSKRQGNRGIESIALSPDEQFIYFILQNPLANPNAATYEKAKNTRIFKFDHRAGKLVGEWVYQLDDPRSFALDPSEKQNDPRISELTALGPDRLLVLERTEKTTKLYEIVLAGAANILGSAWDRVETSPSLEGENDLAKLGLVPVSKTLRFDTARDFKSAPEKIEGVAFLADGAMVLINDNDFGIRGDQTKILIVRGAVSPDPMVYRR
jgi:hypothetical protein